MERLKSMLVGKRLIIALGIFLTVAAAPLGILLMNQFMDASADSRTVSYSDLKSLIDPKRSSEAVKLNANDKLQIPSNPKDGVSYRLESVSINANTGALTTTLEGIARFYPPATDDHNSKSVLGNNDMAMYKGTSYDIGVDASDKGFSTYVIVLNENAPTSYEFDFELPSGFNLREDGNGGIEILNADNIAVGAIAPPWAVDADGDAVKTAYKLSGSTLVQTLEHIGAEYPVVADPDISLGTAVYLRYDLADDVEDSVDSAKKYLTYVKDGN